MRPEAAIPERLVVLDMDGVVTSERRYWDAAGLAAAEVLGRVLSVGTWSPDPAAPLAELERLAREIVPDDFVALAKGRAIATNWDLAHLATALHFIDSLGVEPRPETADRSTSALARAFFDRHADAWGLGYIDCIETELEVADWRDPCEFHRNGPRWREMFVRFQSWYLGSERYRAIYDDEPPPPERPGLAAAEEAVVPAARLAAAFERLRGMGATLAIATGRPRAELQPLLERWDVWRFFDAARVATNDDVAAAEEDLKSLGRHQFLAKPHPFLFVKAIVPDLAAADAAEARGPWPGVTVVGDSAGDLEAAKSIGARSVLVETGAGDVADLEPDFVVPDVTCLAEILETIWSDE